MSISTQQRRRASYNAGMYPEGLTRADAADYEPMCGAAQMNSDGYCYWDAKITPR